MAKKEADYNKKIEEKRRELEAQNIRLDMGYIKKLAADEARYNKLLAERDQTRRGLLQLRTKRVSTLRSRWEARERVADVRDGFARGVSATLRKVLLGDLKVSLKMQRNAHSPQAVAHIIATMGWRTVQQVRAGLLVEKLTLPRLLEVIDKREATKIRTLKGQGDVAFFTKGDAEEIVEKLGESSIRFALERCEVHDLPKLIVTKEMTNDTGDKKYVPREFSKLSLGQQQSVLLAVVLASSSQDPLLIDQPEDNLDGEFIYRSLVPVLRRAKERRQVVVVTHNANIAVLGDAEQLVILKSTSDKGWVVARGSIDSADARALACQILEGSEEAFQRRAKIYGIGT